MKKFLGKKFLVVALFLLVLGGAGALATGGGETTNKQKFEIPPPTTEQLKNAEEWQKYRVRYDTPKCSGDILVRIGDVKLMVPRDSTFQLNSGKILRKDKRHPLYNCEIYKISDVAVVTWRDLSLSDPNFGDTKTMYQRKSEIIKEAVQTKNIAAIGSGLRKVTLTNSEIYIFPPDKFPTVNKEPVALYCEGLESRSDQFRAKSCYTSYLHPLSLSVGYKFFRYNHPASSYIAIDKKYRHMLEEMAQRAQKSENRKENSHDIYFYPKTDIGHGQSEKTF